MSLMLQITIMLAALCNGDNGLAKKQCQEYYSNCFYKKIIPFRESKTSDFYFWDDLPLVCAKDRK